VRDSVELKDLIYELLDARDDTARLVATFELHPGWRAHLDYLRMLQRRGHETLALIAEG
jgi:hypothetical protein